MTRNFTHMSLRSRLALLAAVAVAIAVTGAAIACWAVTQQQLTNQLDNNLTNVQASPGYVQALLRTCGTQQTGAGTSDSSPTPYTIQVVTADGTVCTAPGKSTIKVLADDVAVARGLKSSALHDSEAEDGVVMRVATSKETATPGWASRSIAISIAQPLTVVDEPLETLALLLFGVAGFGVVGAATAGLAIARAGLRPIERLTQTVEHIADTDDLSTQIPVSGEDEINRLARSFNSMTTALAESRDRQQQLIADAGHELRTPLTSLRTNIELLIRSENSGRVLPSTMRTELLDSITEQITELSSLVTDLQELSRQEGRSAHRTLQVEPLHEIAASALRRSRLRGPNLSFVDALEPWYVRAERHALERAIVNLLDNAVKFSPPGGEVAISLRGGTLQVRDHGPGIPEQDLLYVFERFWRSPSARSLPGSGLGLSIVSHVVTQAGGKVDLQNAQGGGTVATVRIPGAPTPPPGVEPSGH
ncbi:sensor histidine kinase [Streptomyces sp. NPDC127106]|uniref:sensor histidine kinase n=1 Tax=Streptomyces sp. NPDC127106 TaxID=3345360 RepID=UPI003639F25C